MYIKAKIIFALILFFMYEAGFWVCHFTEKYQRKQEEKWKSNTKTIVETD